MGKSFKDYEHEGWTKKASQYERVTLPLTRQGFEPILTSFGDLTGKRLLDVCTGPGHLADEAASRGALVDAVDFSEAMAKEIGQRCWVDLVTAEQREMIERHVRAVMLDYLLGRM